MEQYEYINPSELSDLFLPFLGCLINTLEETSIPYDGTIYADMVRTMIMALWNTDVITQGPTYKVDGQFTMNWDGPVQTAKCLSSLFGEKRLRLILREDYSYVMEHQPRPNNRRPTAEPSGNSTHVNPGAIPRILSLSNSSYASPPQNLVADGLSSIIGTRHAPIYLDDDADDADTSQPPPNQSQQTWNTQSQPAPFPTAPPPAVEPAVIPWAPQPPQSGVPSQQTTTHQQQQPLPQPPPERPALTSLPQNLPGRSGMDSPPQELLSSSSSSLAGLKRKQAEAGGFAYEQPVKRWA